MNTSFPLDDICDIACGGERIHDTPTQPQTFERHCFDAQLEVRDVVQPPRVKYLSAVVENKASGDTGFCNRAF